MALHTDRDHGRGEAGVLSPSRALLAQGDKSGQQASSTAIMQGVVEGDENNGAVADETADAKDSSSGWSFM